MGTLDRYGRGAAVAIVALGVSALVVVGLLSGACSTSRPAGYCWAPDGTCYQSTIDGESLFSCPHGQRFDEGTCPAELRVGRCVRPPTPENHAIYLYAPLHGIVPPNCERIAGPGAYFIRE